MDYRPVRGSTLTLEQAQRYGDRIAKLLEQNENSIVAEQVIDDAKRKRSPLHDYFTWDDEIAATKWRIEQASHLLRSINVAIKTNEHEGETRAFINVKLDDSYTAASTESVYVTVKRAMGDQQLRQQVIAEALRQLKAWQKKYRQYQELASIIAAIDEFIESD